MESAGTPAAEAVTTVAEAAEAVTPVAEAAEAVTPVAEAAEADRTVRKNERIKIRGFISVFTEWFQNIREYNDNSVISSPSIPSPSAQQCALWGMLG